MTIIAEWGSSLREATVFAPSVYYFCKGRPSPHIRLDVVYLEKCLQILRSIRGAPTDRYLSCLSKRSVGFAIGPCVARRHAADLQLAVQNAIDRLSAGRLSIPFLAIDLHHGVGATILFR